MTTGEQGGPLDPSVAMAPVVSEQSFADVHRERVAEGMKHLFNGVDAIAAQLIGFEGNIRETLLNGLVPTSPNQHYLDLDLVDPVLELYVRDETFRLFMDSDGSEASALYKVEFRNGMFVPSVYVGMEYESTSITLHTGPDKNRFHHATIKNVSGDHVTQIETFAPNDRDGHKSPQPLTITRGQVQDLHTSIVYGNADPQGRVTPIDGQIVFDPSGHVAGRYHAATQTIESTVTSRPFPYKLGKLGFIIGSPHEAVILPTETNVHAEVESLIWVVDAIGQFTRRYAE